MVIQSNKILKKQSLHEELLKYGNIQVKEVLINNEELSKELKDAVITTYIQGRKKIKIEHPLVIGELGLLPNSFYNKQLINKKQLLKDFEQSGEYESYLYVIERPFRIWFFVKLMSQNKIEKLSKQYWKILSSLWTDSENIFQNKELWKDLMKDKTNSHYFMTDDDLNTFNSLDDSFIVYRGYTHWADGYSYTLDKDIAIWFSERYGGKGKVIEKVVRKDDVFALTNSRKEKEIILLPPY